MTSHNASPTKTLQEIFDFGLAHIRKQGGPCHNENGNCVYRNDKGHSYIVGGFLTPETYLPEFDQGLTSVGVVAGGISFRKAMLAAGVNVSDPKVLALLIEMQNCHDTANCHRYLEVFNSSMYQVAYEFGLSYTDPKEVMT